MAELFVWGKIGWLNLIVFKILLVIFIVGLVYIVLDFRFINFFMPFKMWKRLELQMSQMQTNKNLLSQ